MKKIQKKYQELSAEEQVRVIARVAADQKALDVVALDVRGLASFADYFVIMAGTSTRHVQGLADVIDREISNKRAKSSETEGVKEGYWILLDYGDLIVHIFYHETRPDFDLEGLWHDAPRVDLTQPAPVVKEATGKKKTRKVASWMPAEESEDGVAKIAPKTAKKAAEKVAAKKARRPASAADDKPARKTAAKPARKTAAKPARKTAAKPARKTATKPAPKSADKPARWTAEKPARKTAEKPPRWKDGKPVRKTAETSDSWTAEKPARWTADKPARKTAAKPARKSVGTPVKKTSTVKPKGKPVGRAKK